MLLACSDRVFDFNNMSVGDINSVREHMVSLIHRRIRENIDDSMPNGIHPWSEKKSLRHIYPIEVDNNGVTEIGGISIAVSREFGVESGRRGR